MKNCPFCAEQIQDEALKCRYCGESLDTDRARWRAYSNKFDALSAEERAAALARLTTRQRAVLKTVSNAAAQATAVTVPTNPNTPVPERSRVSTFRQLRPLWIAVGGLLALVVLLRLLGIEPERPTSRDDAGVPTQSKAAARDRIDTEFSTTADEFNRRLMRNYDGRLDTFRYITGTGVIYVSWSSSKCEHFDGELVDLVLSINRTQNLFAVDMKGRRSCDDTFTDFQIGGNTVHDYKLGQINDTELLRQIQKIQE